MANYVKRPTISGLQRHAAKCLGQGDTHNAESALGQSRQSRDVRVTSVLPPKADIHRKVRHVSNVPTTEVTRPIQAPRRQSPAARVER